MTPVKGTGDTRVGFWSRRRVADRRFLYKRDVPAKEQAGDESANMVECEWN